MKKVAAFVSEIAKTIKSEWTKVNANQLYDLCCRVAKPKIDSKPRLNPWRF
jgi:hypothetical protein